MILNASSEGWLKYMYRYKKPLWICIIFSMNVLMVETLELRCFILSLIFFTLLHARLWLIASWPLLLPIYLLAGNLPLLTGCFQQHSTTWQIKARYIIEHQLKQSHSALPPPSLVNFGIKQWHIQLLTSSPGCFHSPLTSPIHNYSCSFLLQLWENTNSI